MTKPALLRTLTVTCGLLVLHGCKSDTAKDASLKSVVLEQGRTPRRTLRYTIEEGSTTTSTMELSISSMTTTASAGEDFTEEPGLRVVVASGPAVKLPNGNVRLETRILLAEAITPPGADPDIGRDLNTSAALLRDAGGWIEVDNRGVVRRSELNEAAKNPNLPVRLVMTIAQARTSLARVVLPIDPVGVTGRWEERKRFKVFGFEIQQVDRYTLNETAGDELRLRVEIVESAPNQTVTFEEEGLEFTLQSLSVSARGDVTVNLNALESSARVQGRSTEILTVKRPEGTEEIKLDSVFQVNIDVEHEPAPPG